MEFDSGWNKNQSDSLASDIFLVTVRFFGENWILSEGIFCESETEKILKLTRVE